MARVGVMAGKGWEHRGGWDGREAAPAVFFSRVLQAPFGKTLQRVYYDGLGHKGSSAVRTSKKAVSRHELDACKIRLQGTSPNDLTLSFQKVEV